MCGGAKNDQSASSRVMLLYDDDVRFPTITMGNDNVNEDETKRQENSDSTTTGQRAID